MRNIEEEFAKINRESQGTIEIEESKEILRNVAKHLLATLGIQRIEEVESNGEKIDLPVFPKSYKQKISAIEDATEILTAPARNIRDLKRLMMERTPKNIEKYLTILARLGINKDTTISYRKDTVKFTDSTRDPGTPQEELSTFSREADIKDGETAPITIFLPGGGFRGFEGSTYNPLITAAGAETHFIATDARGFTSHLDKINYNLIDRLIDALVALQIAIKRFGDKWNGKIILFGDSMGGHAAAELAGLLGDILDRDYQEKGINLASKMKIILTEPASYSSAAEYSPFINLLERNRAENLDDLIKILEAGDELRTQVEDIYNELLEKSDMSNEYRIIEYTKENKIYYIRVGLNDDNQLVFRVASSEQELIGDKSFTDRIQDKKLGDPEDPDDSRAMLGIKKHLKRKGKVSAVIMTKDDVVPEGINAQFVKLIKNEKNGSILKVDGQHGATTLEEIMFIVEKINE